MEWLKRDGVSIAFEDAGSGAPPILLIHDQGSDHTTWRAEFEQLRLRRRVVAVDLPGHGESDRLPQAPTVGCFADWLAWLCYELGLYRPVAVGLGMGGEIAAHLAVTCPELLEAVVALDAPMSQSATEVSRMIDAAIHRNVGRMRRG